ncbi:MAG: glycoside hydrolase family 9 protein, partial [Bacteroidales bacterium]|nr:glycoside hydrolase family 9 protein [Bacteroidales bacterium]
MNRKHLISLTVIFAFSVISLLNSQSWIRINQLGYLPASVKVAVLVSKDGITLTEFELHHALTGKVLYKSDRIKGFGAYGAFKSGFRLDFSDYVQQGPVCIVAAGVKSPVFNISESVYDGTADFLLHYMRQQRCGYNPFLHDSCHTHDGYRIYHPLSDSARLDVTGGWHDATDYLQYTATSANAVYQMLLAYIENPDAFGDAYLANGERGSNEIPDILDEIKWGLDWLLKMNPDSGEMYNQIADDRDHQGFRLPNQDSVSYGKGLERPVYFCTGEVQGVRQYKNRATGIASTAGKFASAFAMGALVLKDFDADLSRQLADKAIDAWEFGKANPGACQTAPCTAPYFYEEDNWTDDMELAGSVLYELTGKKEYLDEAVMYGRQEHVTPWMGADTARHYQWYPFLNMGHWGIGKSSDELYAAEFTGYWRKGIENVWNKGKNNPFLNGVPGIWCSNNLTVALLTQCHLYARLTGDRTFDEMEAALRDWLFGCNPWGSSMIIGLPAYGDYPADPHSSLSVLHGYALDGGLVDGPVYHSIFSNLKGIAMAGGDEYHMFQSNHTVYHDDYADYSTNEPTMDGTADLTYYLSAMQQESKAGAKSNNELEYSYGAIIRGDTTRKQITLVFTGHDLADGFKTVRSVLKAHKIRASFFLTGDFYRNRSFSRMIKALRKDGHYLGAHSDKHLLYCDWNKRDSLLVNKTAFLADLRANYVTMGRYKIQPEKARFFLPPYEWYNDSIAAWCNQYGLTLVNFTPGTSSNQDWTYP